MEDAGDRRRIDGADVLGARSDIAAVVGRSGCKTEGEASDVASASVKPSWMDDWR